MASFKLAAEFAGWAVHGLNGSLFFDLILLSLHDLYVRS